MSAISLKDVPGITLRDVPLDVPIPTTESLYAWWEPDGVWVTWTDYVFLLARQKKPPARSASSGDAAAAERRTAQSSLFERGMPL